MKGELIHTYNGVDSEGFVSNAVGQTTIHGSWFETMDDVNKKIAELEQEEGTRSVEWFSFE